LNKTDTDAAGWIGWYRPIAGYASTWTPLVASIDLDLAWDLLRDHAPPGAHLVVLPAWTEPAPWSASGSQHWD
jgi:hypothetical protein